MFSCQFFTWWWQNKIQCQLDKVFYGKEMKKIPYWNNEILLVAKTKEIVQKTTLLFDY
jgi:hypothetical protein